MKHYAAIKSNNSVEVFQDANNESEILKGVLDWWEEIEPQYPRAFLDVITFLWGDEDGLVAEVYWSWLDKETDDALVKEINKPQALEVNENNISGN